MKTFCFLLLFLVKSIEVNAQVTLNFDDFSEDFISEKKIEHSPKIQLTPISHDDVKKAPEKKKDATKKEKAKKTPQKPPKKKNYVIKELGKEDAHDKLKPRSEPVPVVKIQEIKIQKDQIKTEKEAQVASFETEQQKEESSEKNEDIVEVTSKVNTTNSSESVVKKEDDVFSGKKELFTTEKKVFPLEKKQNNSFVRKELDLSVLSINERDFLKRSEILRKFLPTDSKSYIDTQKGKYLYSILSFEKKSSHLTEDMENEIEKISVELQKNKRLNLIIYSYSGPTDPEYGREHHLSLQRALRVRSSFSKKGITIHRISYRSWGKIGAGTEHPDRVDILFYEK